MVWLVLACQNSDTVKNTMNDDDTGKLIDTSLESLPPFDCDEVFAQLTSGVNQIDMGDSLPSDFVLLNLSACPIVWDESARSYVVSASLGSGRLVFMGHEGLLGPSESNVGGRQLLANVLRWTGKSDTPQVGVLQSSNSIVAAVEASGATVVPVEFEQLDSLDVLVMNPYDTIIAERQSAIVQFVESGGGLVVGGHAWWWAYSNPGLSVGEDYTAAWLSDVSGVQWTAQSDVSAGLEIVSSEPPTALQHAVYALDMLSGELSSPTLSEADISLGAFTVGRAIDAVPLSNADFFDPAREYSVEVGPIRPTVDNPLIPAQQPIELLSARIEYVLATKDIPEHTEAHPAAEDFPGFPSGGSPCRGHVVSIDGSYEGRESQYLYAGTSTWVSRSTGVYALPGSVIEIAVPQAIVDAGFEMSIGSHTDQLWHKEEITRFPALVRREPINTTLFEMSSGFGGLVYIWVPSGSELGLVDVEMNGGVFAPIYRHGETTTEVWRTEQQNNPAPFGELLTDGLRLTLPSEHLRSLNDPQALMDFYDAVVSANSALEGRLPSERRRSEWVVFDRQISAGWMHSGYPVMAHLESVPNVLSLDSMSTQGDWGIFHELGHNHQWRDWLLPGTTETTCNLWSVYVMEMVVGIGTNGHQALSPETRAERMAAYLDNGALFSEWSVWVALESYLQLQEAFGWEIYSNLFLKYRELDDSQRPNTDQERIDLWVTMMSEEVGRDLSPFYLSWGLPISPQTITNTSVWPEWSNNPME
ncbi:MAG: M60 family metallopeptidase [Myxococcota bacterium]|nr:M60 family metallopeptidase [Myxococcota bacterium]